MKCACLALFIVAGLSACERPQDQPLVGRWDRSVASNCHIICARESLGEEDVM